MSFYQHLKELLREMDIRAMGRPLLLASLVGVIAGLGAVAFSAGVHWCDSFFITRLGQYHPLPKGLAMDQMAQMTSLRTDYRWYLFLIPVIGGLVSGFLVFRFAPEAEGHGTDAAIDAYHNKGGMIRGRVPIVKGLASVITIGTGGSAGKEGPVAQIGAGFGSWLAGRLGLDTAERRVLLLAGMAGGIGATFRAPLGGALFAVEVLYQDPDFEHEGLIPAIISSIVAYSIFGAVTGWKPLLATPVFVFEHPSEMFSYLLLGIFCALFGRFYVRVFYGIQDRFRAIPLPAMVKPAIGGLLVGLLALLVPQVLGSGYGMVQAALYGKLAIGVMLVVALAKIFATSFTISSGGSGGVFAPSLVIGAMLGGSFGAIMDSLFPALVQDPRAYVLIGMAGFFAGVSNTPIATLIMVCELTGNYALLAPLMLVCVVAMVVFRKNTIYCKQVANRTESPAHYGDFIVDVLEGIHVADLAEHGRKPHTIPEHMPLSEILKRIADADGAYYPTVDSDGNMTGIFSVNDIRRILADDLPPMLVLARDIANANVITARPDEPLTDVMRKMSSRGLEEIPVMDITNPRKVHFMLSRRAVLARYAAELEKKKKIYRAA